MTDAEKYRAEYAGKIISGEYKSFVISMIDEKGIRHCFYEGDFTTVVGLLEIAKSEMLHKSNKTKDIDDDEE